MSPPSLHAVVDEPGQLTVEELLEAHARQLAAVVESVGVAPAADASGLDRPTLRDAVGGDAAAVGDLELRAVASVLALADGTPSAADLVAEALDELLFGMTAGVIDVEVVAAEVPLDLEPREVQAMLEGRHPATLRQFVALQRVIADRAR